MLLDLSKLETKFETLNFDKGEVLFRQGEINGDGFILKSGVVGLTREMEGAIVQCRKNKYRRSHGRMESFI